MSGEARRRWTAWSVSWLAYATYYLGRKGLSVSKTTLNETEGVSMNALAAIDTFYLSAYAVGQFLSGELGDRLGSRRLVGFGMLAVAACIAAFGLSTGVVALGLFFCLNGVAQSTGWPGTTRAMAEWTTASNRGRVMGFWGTCYPVGGVVATVLATFCLVEWGWRSAFLVPAALVAVVGVVVLLTLRSPERTPAERPIRDGAGAPHAAPAVMAGDDEAPQTSVYRNRKLWCFGTSYFCIKLVRYSLLFWLPTYLDKGLGYDKATAGYVSTAFEVGGPVGMVVVGYLSDRVTNRSRAVVAAAGLVALAAILLAYGRVAHLGVTTNVLLLGAVGFALFGPDSLISGAAAQDSGGRDAAARATGFVNGVGSIGAIASSWVTVRVSEAFGWQSLFTVFVVLAVVAALALVPALGRRTAPA